MRLWKRVSRPSKVTASRAPIASIASRSGPASRAWRRSCISASVDATPSHRSPSIRRPTTCANDEERPAKHGCVRRRRDRAGRRVAECRDRILDNRFQNGSPGIVLYPDQSEDQRLGPCFEDGVEPEREDLRVVTTGDGHWRLGVLEAGLAELGAEVIEETAREVVRASKLAVLQRFVP